MSGPMHMCWPTWGSSSARYEAGRAHRVAQELLLVPHVPRIKCDEPVPWRGLPRHLDHLIFLEDDRMACHVVLGPVSPVRPRGGRVNLCAVAKGLDVHLL